MKNLRIGSFVFTGLMLVTAGLRAAPELTRIVPGTAPMVLHVRSIPELREKWAKTPFARTWADASVQKFFAPTIAKMSDPENGIAAKMKADTGLTTEEFFALFPGEAIMAINDFAPYFRDEEKKNPQLLLAIELGDARAKFEEALKRGRDAAAKKGEDLVDEEFQGETIHVVVKPSEDDPDTRVESEAWAIVDKIFIMGEPKSVVHQAVAAIKKGGMADSLADNPAFGALYRKSPGTNAVFHLGFDSLIPALVSMLETSEGNTDENGNPTGPAAKLAQFGLTPQGLFHTLGLDALQSFDLSLALGDRESTIEGAVRWTEQRGLLRMAAYGEPPVGRPDFMPESWLLAGVDRFSIPTAYTALMETLAELSPMLEGFVRQQIRNMNTQLGIDIERDLIGSMGDVLASGYALPPSGTLAAGESPDQFFALSLSNAETFTRAVDALLGGTPLGQMMQPREYLGETIREMSPPSGKPFAIAITRGQLLVSIGGPSMVEAAIQGLQGDAVRPIWKKAEVVEALDALPPGASSVVVADAGRLMGVAINFLADLSAKAGVESPEAEEGEEDEETPSPTSSFPVAVDASSRPSPEVIAKYWSMLSRGLYIEPTGIRVLVRMGNGQ